MPRFLIKAVIGGKEKTTTIVAQSKFDAECKASDKLAKLHGCKAEDVKQINAVQL